MVDVRNHCRTFSSTHIRLMADVGQWPDTSPLMTSSPCFCTFISFDFHKWFAIARIEGDKISNYKYSFYTYGVHVDSSS